MDILVWNSNGLGRKLESQELQNYLINYDVISLSETWLTEHQLQSSEVYFDSYEVISVVQ